MVLIGRLAAATPPLTKRQGKKVTDKLTIKKYNEYRKGLCTEKDYENPSGKCHAGVSYTAKEWISRWFPKLTTEDFDIKRRLVLPKATSRR